MTIKLEGLRVQLFSWLSGKGVSCLKIVCSAGMKYLVIMKIPCMSCMHPQFSEARNLALPVKTNTTFNVSVALTAATINLPVTALQYLTIYVPLRLDFLQRCDYLTASPWCFPKEYSEPVIC